MRVWCRARSRTNPSRLLSTTLPRIDSLLDEQPVSRPERAKPLDLTVLQSPSTLLRFKLLFRAGSADDPAGKEGLAALAAEMIASAGSSDLRIDEIKRALFPMAGSFGVHVDREMTVFTGVIHRDNLDRFADIVLPQLTSPGLSESDFSRLKAAQMNGWCRTCEQPTRRSSARSGCRRISSPGRLTAIPTLGSVAGIESIELEDLRSFIVSHYSVDRVIAGAAGDLPEAFLDRLSKTLQSLPTSRRQSSLRNQGPGGRTASRWRLSRRRRARRRFPFGHPIDVTRPHPDFAALWLARAWLGEHRASNGRLFQRLREIRGLNYGDYAYVEAFPGRDVPHVPRAERRS